MNASASETGLPDTCADVITCAQSFHWMEPESTIAEIARCCDYSCVAGSSVPSAFYRKTGRPV
ncbi:MAG: methyltransferase domain-containing protein [Solirubrobacterales bacterium]|nr:methyltransferase domain-containing protein [Solirubrobacterales bacterium]